MGKYWRLKTHPTLICSFTASDVFGWAISVAGQVVWIRDALITSLRDKNNIQTVATFYCDCFSNEAWTLDLRIHATFPSLQRSLSDRKQCISLQVHSKLILGFTFSNNFLRFFFVAGMQYLDSVLKRKKSQLLPALGCHRNLIF